MSDREIVKAMKEIHWVFVKKPELRESCIEQFKISLRSKQDNLNAAFIQNYLRIDNIQCVNVLFGGSRDKGILEKLNIHEYNTLNILCYDTTNTQRFYVQLENLRTRNLICEIELGYYKKKRRLVETHTKKMTKLMEKQISKKSKKSSV